MANKIAAGCFLIVCSILPFLTAAPISTLVGTSTHVTIRAETSPIAPIQEGAKPKDNTLPPALISVPNLTAQSTGKDEVPSGKSQIGDTETVTVTESQPISEEPAKAAEEKVEASSVKSEDETMVTVTSESSSKEAPDSESVNADSSPSTQSVKEAEPVTTLPLEKAEVTPSVTSPETSSEADASVASEGSPSVESRMLKEEATVSEAAPEASSSDDKESHSVKTEDTLTIQDETTTVKSEEPPTEPAVQPELPSSSEESASESSREESSENSNDKETQTNASNEKKLVPLSGEAPTNVKESASTSKDSSAEPPTQSEEGTVSEDSEPDSSSEESDERNEDNPTKTDSVSQQDVSTLPVSSDSTVELPSSTEPSVSSKAADMETGGLVKPEVESIPMSGIPVQESSTEQSSTGSPDMVTVPNHPAETSSDISPRDAKSIETNEAEITTTEIIKETITTTSPSSEPTPVVTTVLSEGDAVSESKGPMESASSSPEELTVTTTEPSSAKDTSAQVSDAPIENQTAVPDTTPSPEAAPTSEGTEKAEA